MVIKRNSYYNTGRFHRRKNTRKQLGLEIHMDWSLSTLFETGLNILSWLAWNSQRSTSVRSLLWALSACGCCIFRKVGYFGTRVSSRCYMNSNSPDPIF